MANETPVARGGRSGKKKTLISMAAASCRRPQEADSCGGSSGEELIAFIKVLRTSRRALESLRPCGLAACSPWLLALRLLLRWRLRLLPGRLPKKRRKLRKWSPGGAKIDPRRRQNGFLEASGGLLSAKSAPGGRPGRSETASGRLLGRSWRLLGRFWGDLGGSWAAPGAS